MPSFPSLTFLTFLRFLGGLALCALLTVSAGRADEPTIQSYALPSAPAWLTADGAQVAALLANGTVVAPDGNVVRSLGGGYAPATPIRRCFDQTMGISRPRGNASELRAVHSRGHSADSQGASLSPLSGIECGLAAVWAIGTRGEIVRLEQVDGLWESVKRAPVDALLDGRIVRFDLAANSDPKLFVLAAPSTRYAHGVLGDAIEPTALKMIDPHSLQVESTLSLPEPYVFEDLSVRPVKLGGRHYLALVRSSDNAGSGVALIGLEKGELAIIATGPEIGRGQRWMNLLVPRSANDTDAGAVLYAVETPHIGGRLHRYALKGRRLEATFVADGVSTHAIGSRVLDAYVFLSPTRMIVPNQARNALRLLDCAAECREVKQWTLSGTVVTNLVLTRDSVWVGTSDRKLQRLGIAGNK